MTEYIMVGCLGCIWVQDGRTVPASFTVPPRTGVNPTAFSSSHEPPFPTAHPLFIKPAPMVRPKAYIIPIYISADKNKTFLSRLDEKLNGEPADLLEVIRAVAAARGSSIGEVEAIRRDKAVKRGGFEKKPLLAEIIYDR